jgi:U4/U6 small nuclear ribonucleoprotein PRP4
VAFHPTGRFVASASFDTTWRLWDTTTGTSILEQDGHSRQVYCVAFHPDGSLISTGGLDGLCKLWDLRTGRCILNLQGHIKQVISTDFSPTAGHQLATGSQDNTIKIWDLRAMKCGYTIPGHTSLVSQVKYYATSRVPTVQDYESINHNGTSSLKSSRGSPIMSGMFLVSSGFDGMVNIWTDQDYKLLKSLKGHEGKVMGVDVSPDAKYIASAGYDRTFKLWANPHVE